MSCFALHVAECEQTGRDGSAANYLTAYRMLVKYMNGRKLLPEQFTAEWLERYERWLLARGLGTNSVVFHMRYLRAVYNKAEYREQRTAMLQDWADMIDEWTLRRPKV